MGTGGKGLAAVFAGGLAVALVSWAVAGAPAAHDGGAMADGAPAVMRPAADSPPDAGGPDEAAAGVGSPAGGAPARGAGDVGPGGAGAEAERSDVGEGYVAGTALVRVADGVTPPDVSCALAGLEGVDADVMPQEVVPGVLSVSLLDGADVSDVVDGLAAAAPGLIEGAQPDYLYEPIDGDDSPSLAGMVNAGSGLPGPAASGVGAMGALAAQGVADELLAGCLPVTVNDPYGAEQWALGDSATGGVRAHLAWALAKGEDGNDRFGTPVTVAVLDRGFNITHVDLRDNVIGAYNAVTRTTTPTDLAGLYPQHGTKVAGILSARANNGIGIAGVSYNARVMPVRVSDAQGTMTSSSVAAGYQYVLEHAAELNVRVVNLSIAARGQAGGAYDVGRGRDDVLLDQISVAREATVHERGTGILTVAAAGNGTITTPPYAVYPADYADVISVINLRQLGDGGVVRSGALGEDVRYASNYNAGDERSKNIAAPGTNIKCTTSNGGYGSDTGTSMASPCVAGVLALEFAANPWLTAREAEDILYRTARDLGEGGFDAQTGWGEVDAAAAVAEALSAHVHELEGVPRVAPTCVAEGVEAHWACALCGRCFADAGGSVELERPASIERDPRAHSLAHVGRVEATCVATGVREHWSCDRCGRRFSDEGATSELVGSPALPVDPAAHDWDGGVVTTAPTATVAGVRTYTCRRDAGHVRTEAVPALGEEPSGDGGQPGGEAPPSGGDPGSPGGDATATDQPGGEAPVADPSVSYRAHVQNKGWEQEPRPADGELSGTIGQSLRLEAIEVAVSDLPCAGGIEYRAHVQNKGWEATWARDGAMSGTSGERLRLEAIQVRLTGELAGRYDVYYQVHAQNAGWLGWARNGASAGTQGRSARLEAIRIVLVAKEGGGAPGETAAAFLNGSAALSGVPEDEALVLYRAHVQNVGWQAYARDGEPAGTSGRRLRLEGVGMRLGGALAGSSIAYQAHIQNTGWEQGWSRDDEVSGTQGRHLRLEAIKIALEGPAAADYSVYYQVHAQNAGWLGWARDGEPAGTAHHGWRLEGLRVVLVRHGDDPPPGGVPAFLD